MPIKVMRAAKLAFLNLLAGYAAQDLDGLLLHLFVNDYRPVDDDALGNYRPASWTGYNPQVLTGWGPAVATDDGHALVQAPVLYFQNLTARTVQAYGAFVTDPARTSLFWAERWIAPKLLDPGQLLPYFPAFSDTSEF